MIRVIWVIWMIDIDILADNSKNANLSAFDNFFDNLTSRNVRVSDSATKRRKKL